MFTLSRPALVPLLILLLLGSVAACSKSADAKELAEASLLTVDDLPGGGWVVTQIDEDELVSSAQSMADDRPDECRYGSASEPLSMVERVADESVTVIRSFRRDSPDDGLVAEGFTVSVVAFDSTDDLNALIEADSSVPADEVQRALESCDSALADRTGLTYSRSEEPPTLSLPDAMAERMAFAVSSDDDLNTRIVVETHWFVRDRVLAVFTIGESNGAVDYQSLLEEFERRVVAAQD